MKYYLASIPALGLFLAACDPAAQERDCGVFDHPSLLTWQEDLSAGVVQFEGVDGSVNSFDRRAIVLNEPFVSSLSANNSEEVTCFLFATSTLVSQDGELSIITNYIQSEIEGVDPIDEKLQINSTIQSPVGTNLTGSFDAGLGGPDDQLQTLPTNAVTFLEDVTIGGVLYSNAVSIDSFDRGIGTTFGEPSASKIDQLIYANQFGLVSYTDSDGNQFVRIPD